MGVEFDGQESVVIDAVQRVAQLDIDAVVGDVPVHRESELEMRREPLLADSDLRVAQIADDRVEILGFLGLA